MRRLLLGTVCVVSILGGCADQSTSVQSNNEQTKEINDLKKQIEEISAEKDELLTILKEERETLELAMNQQVEKENYSMIQAKDIDKYPQTLYKSVTFDTDGDGEEEVIELYVNAGEMENDLFAWDDGQSWLLVLKDGEKTYPLFDDYVQMGSIDFTTSRFDKKPGIVMIKAQHSDRTVQKFTYDKKENGYQKEIFYKKENTNDQYNQPASYAFFKDAYKLMNAALTIKTLPVLEANEQTLQDLQERRLIIEPILVDIYKAQGLLEMVAELNTEMNVSLDGVIELLNQISSKPPTAEQMNQLKSIYDAFKDVETNDLIIEEENQIHPEIREKLERLKLIP